MNTLSINLFEKKLENYFLQKPILNAGTLCDITTNIQDSTKSHIIFYYIGEKKRDEDQFLKRFKQSSPSVLVVNRLPSFLQGSKNICLMDKGHFLAAQKEILDILYPTDDIPLIVGITGTNGKTTVASLSTQIASLLGQASLSIGTLGVMDAQGQCLHPLDSTTPSYIELRKIIHRFKDTRIFFLETSSHGLQQKRLFNLKLKTAAWTNFTQDHLDYHKDMDSYFLSKLKITDYLEDNGALIVPAAELALFERIKKHHRVKKAKPLGEYSLTGLPNCFDFPFNQNNLELSLALNEQLWGPLPPLNMEKLFLPKGRFTTIGMKKGMVIIDYAHTPAALENIAMAIKTHLSPAKFSIVFGCGGERDFSKRPLMGKVACDNADFVYLTSDNPRGESPEQIIEDIKEGRISQKIHCQTDRKKAIEKALKNMNENEVVLIAGKGHEEYQQFAHKKIHFSDIEIVENFKKDNK